MRNSSKIVDNDGEDVINSWESWKILKNIALCNKKKYVFIDKLANEMGSSCTNPVFRKVFKWLVEKKLITCTELVGRSKSITEIKRVEIAMLCEKFEYFQEVNNFIDSIKYW